MLRAACSSWSSSSGTTLGRPVVPELDSTRAARPRGTGGGGRVAENVRSRSCPRGHHRSHPASRRLLIRTWWVRSVMRTWTPSVRHNPTSSAALASGLTGRRRRPRREHQESRRHWRADCRGGDRRSVARRRGGPRGSLPRHALAFRDPTIEGTNLWLHEGTRGRPHNRPEDGAGPRPPTSTTCHRVLPPEIELIGALLEPN